MSRTQWLLEGASGGWVARISRRRQATRTARRPHTTHDTAGCRCRLGRRPPGGAPEKARSTQGR